METIMTKTSDTSYDAVAKSERELTDDELNYVSGGRGEAPVKYMEYKLKEVLISGVTLSS
jgi:hypothetical protein